jgi:Do/DeqQ family serine protease
MKILDYFGPWRRPGFKITAGAAISRRLNRSRPMALALRPAAALAAAALAAALVLSPALGRTASAQDTRLVPFSPGDLRLSYAPVVKRAAPSVVNVYAAKVVANRNPLLDDPFFRQFFGGDRVPREQVQRSLGSGVIVDPSGFVVTNNHVIEGADQVKVSLADNREFEATIVLKDSRSDLAVLRLKDAKERFPAIDFADSDTLQVGDVVLAIGNPFGVGQTVTHGIVSAVARTQVGITDYQFFIQTDAAINPGNSGGALVDLAGRLVGINTAIFSRSGGSQGIGFAIPANMVRVVVTSARGGGSVVRRPWLGAKLQAVTPEIADSLGLKRPAGALVASITPGSPAAKGGLRNGDLIESIDGVVVEDSNAFDYRFATKPLGGQAQLGIVRSGKDARLPITLETAPETAHNEIVIKSRSPFLGAKVSNLSPALAEQLRIDSSTEGVVILDIETGSTAQTIGFQKGDIVVSVNDQQIGTTADLERAAKQTARLWRVTILRDGQQISVAFSG